MVVMTLVSIPLMDRTGRRTLHLYGLGGMFIFSIFITISFLIKVSAFRLEPPNPALFIYFLTHFHKSFQLWLPETKIDYKKLFCKFLKNPLQNF